MRITDTVKHLLIINVVMFIGTMAIGNGELFGSHGPDALVAMIDVAGEGVFSNAQ